VFQGSLYFDTGKGKMKLTLEKRLLLKKAAATTAFIVIFLSLSGFFGYAAIVNINRNLLIFAAAGFMSGALAVKTAWGLL
jgi:uncharacterized membrane protein YfcA